MIAGFSPGTACGSNVATGGSSRSDPTPAPRDQGTIVRETPWDRLHLTYFLGYALWNYLTAPLAFRVARVRETRSSSRMSNVGRRGACSRWSTRTTSRRAPKRRRSISTRRSCSSGWITSPTCSAAWPHMNLRSGVPQSSSFPTLRRSVRRTPDGPLLSGRTSFVLDYTNIEIGAWPG